MPMFWLFYAKNSGFKWLREQWWEKVIPVSPYLLTVSELNQSWCVKSLLLGDYILLWCEEVLANIHLVFIDKNFFLSKNSVDDNHASPIKPPILFDEGLLT